MGTAGKDYGSKKAFTLIDPVVSVIGILQQLRRRAQQVLSIFSADNFRCM